MRKAIVLTMLAICTAMSALPAAAAISSTGGAITPIEPPPSVVPGALESNTQIPVFNERSSYVLPAPVTVDITSPGTYDTPDDLTPGVVPAGTLVDMYFLHADPEGTQNNNTLTGSITFDQDILGVIVINANLDLSDVHGNPGTTYPTGVAGRQYEFTGADIVTAPDQRTLQLNVRNNVLVDHMRVITAAAVAPPTGDQGCSHGYWKNHTSQWQMYSPDQTVGSVFTGASASLADDTLLQALGYGGGSGVLGGEKILLKQAVAALLNASHSDVAYPKTRLEVIAATDAALTADHRGNMIALAAEFDGYNNLGCPLN